MDFRSEGEQLKDPRTAMKRSLIFPGAGQIYNDQNIKGYVLIAGEILALWSFNENREKYSNYEESDKHSRNYYLRERNRFAWIAIGLYFYSVLDAVVEAHLDNFDVRWMLLRSYLLWYAFPFVGTRSLWNTFPLHLNKETIKNHRGI